MFEDDSYKAHTIHNDLYEALKKSLELDYSNQRLADQEEARKKRRDVPRTPLGSPPSPPPPPPPLAGASGAPGTSGASGSSQLPLPPPPPSTTASASQSMAWTKSDTRFESTDFTAAQELSPTDSLMQDDSILDEQVHLCDDEDSGNDHLPKADSKRLSGVANNWASALATTYEPPAENSLLAKIGDMTNFPKKVLPTSKQTTAMEECDKMLTDQVDWANPEGDQVRINVNRPLPLGGPPGHVTMSKHILLSKIKDLDIYVWHKGSCPTLSISKMKAASYPDFGLELLVPEQMWIDDVCTYDVSAKYGISHLWFTRQKFYIDTHYSPSHRKDVRTHMRILSVVRIKAYSRYGYDYFSEIVLRRADHQEHTIAEKDFKNLYLSDFEDLNLLLLQVIRQRVKDFQLGIESYQTQLNLTKPRWDATGYEFKHDYTNIESPRAVVFPVNNNERKIMRFNEIYKFSDDTLTRILETLDYRVKEFKIKRLNPGSRVHGERMSDRFGIDIRQEGGGQVGRKAT
ncbi:hypothetical protein Tco_0569724 [Tanacetum coccineum]